MTGYLVSYGYLERPYLTEPYLAAVVEGATGFQANAIIDTAGYLGFQANANIVSETYLGFQTNCIIDAEKYLGFQAAPLGGTFLGFQATVSLYNTTQLRVLHNFVSRGLTGENWTASSTATGDFSPYNINNDIVENVWRSAATGSVNLTCDTEVAQGVSVDTIALLNHNLTTGAIVTVSASNESDFSSIGLSFIMENTPDNQFYISPELPLSQYRYWRFNISDNANPDGFYEIGSIVFGAATILTLGNNFVDEIDYSEVDYADEVATEAFTNVSNSRAVKKSLALGFRSMLLDGQDYMNLRSIFQTYRTVNKCLWIPTPSATDQDHTAQFAMFSKLVRMPSYSIKSVSASINYVSFDVQLDESK